MKKLDCNNEHTSPSGWIALNIWLDQLGRSETTGYRWRKRGWLHTTIIAGKHYLSREQQREFERRATAGEFTQVASGDMNAQPLIKSDDRRIAQQEHLAV